MSAEPMRCLDPRMQHALTELQELIRRRYPEATFRISRAQDDPELVHLNATVDVEDTEEVVDLVVDRMLQLQVDEALPIYVIPTRPIDRALAERRSAPAM